MQWKRLIFYILVNVVVSAITVYVVLTLWENRQQAELERVTTQVVLPEIVPTQDEPILEPTLIPTVALQVHEVRSGETLGDIAQEYDVTVDELLEINGLADADAIGAGQIIYIPEDVVILPTALPEVSENTVAGQIEIVSVVGIGDLGSERLIIGDAGGGKHSLAGWQIRDQDENVYTFPQAILYENGQIVVNTKAGVDNPLELFWGLAEPVWESGETVRLYDDSGQEQASFQVP